MRFTEASTVLKTVAVDFFFNCWYEYLEIPSDNRIRHVRPLPCSKLSIGSVLVEYCFIYEKFVACRKFDLRPSNQSILVRVIPNCFRFAKMCLCQVSTSPVRCSLRYFRSSWGSCMSFIWTAGHVSLRVAKMTWIDLDPLDLILNF
jgi:hypothetical protein